MGVAASLPRRAARRRARLSVFTRVGAVHGLVAVCLASFVARAVAALAKATPIYFPDEYMYAELGRSLAESGRPLVRGAESSFPALLQPLLTAPAWALGDVADGYRLVQLLGALAMSLAAVPVFFLAVRLGLGRGLALALAALAVLFPSVLYSSWVLAEPFAYPLLLAALYAATVALSERDRRAGLAFVFLAGLAALGRAQFAVLPVCFFLAVLALGIRGRAVKRELRSQALPLLLFAGPLAVLVALPRAAGMYGGILNLDLGPAGLAQRLGTNAMGLMYASGWILVPGACLGLVLALGRARSRSELAFGTLTASLTAALLLQASLYGDIDLIQERYTFYAAPLLALSFGLWVTRGWPLRRAHALLALGALTLSVAVPLAGYVAALGKIQSPFLFAGAYLEEKLGEAGTPSLLIAITVGALSLASIGASRLRQQVRTATVVSLALAFCAAASAGAALFDNGNANRVRAAFLPAERSWVDRTGLRDVTLLQGFARRTETAAQLFWNRSVDRLLLLPDGVRPDSFSAATTRVGPDGALTADGRPVAEPLLVDEWGSVVELRGATAVASAPSFRLWKPAGLPRLAFRFAGYFRDGWLAPRGQVSLWPATLGGRVEGTVRFAVTAPADLPAPATLRVSAPGQKSLALTLAPGASRSFVLPVCAQGQWHATLQIDRSAYDGGRFISLRSTRPRFEASSSCPR
jgi:hypothetical protein